MKNIALNWYDSLYSDGTSMFLKPTYPKLNDIIIVKIRAFKESPINKIYLRIVPDGEEIRLPMKVYRNDNIFKWWQVKFPLSTPLMNYRFKILCENRIIWYNAEGCLEYTPSDDADFKIIADYIPPSWLSKRVFYQIFPDTFRDGNPKTNVSDDEYEYLGYSTISRKWGELPYSYKKSHSLDFFGGDLEGIKQSISYFKQLGINALYLNPIFEAPSNHKYDTEDYFRIDPHFGTNEEFAKLTKELHQKNIKIILDGVFNHSGIAIKWFNKCNYYDEEGAYQNPDSPYREFYIFNKHNEEYHSWLGVKTLPTLNYNSIKLRNMIYAGEDSVVKYWLKEPYNIDGWRLDVANMIGRQGITQVHKEVWREFRIATHQANSEAYIMGEHYFDPSELLEGDMLDGVMNYAGFTHSIRHWFTEIDCKGDKSMMTANNMDKQIRHFLSRISWQIALNRYNLINCHDLPRLETIAKDSRQSRLAAIILLTYLGIPSIFYGEEIGLANRGKKGEKGESVESTRFCMEWDKKKWDWDLFRLYRFLIRLRKSSGALQYGSLQILLADTDIYAYARFTSHQMFIIILNNGEAKENIYLPVKLIGLEEGQSLHNLLTDEKYIVDDEGLHLMKLDAYEGLLLRRV